MKMDKDRFECLVEMDLDNSLSHEDSLALLCDHRRWKSELVRILSNIDVSIIEERNRSIKLGKGNWPKFNEWKANQVARKAVVVAKIAQVKAVIAEEHERTHPTYTTDDDDGDDVLEEILKEVRAINSMLADRFST